MYVIRSNITPGHETIAHATRAHHRARRFVSPPDASAHRRFSCGGVVLGWFCGPALMMVATGFLAYLICAFLPRRWQDGRPYGAAPRKVHLSWRSAVLLPVMVPWVLFPGNFL